MSHRSWYGNTLPSRIRQSFIAAAGKVPAGVIYINQSVLRVLLRDGDTTNSQTNFKMFFGLQRNKPKSVYKLVLSPFLIQELSNIVAPNPKRQGHVFTFSEHRPGESLFKLIQEAKDFNLAARNIPKSIAQLKDDLKKKYGPSSLRSELRVGPSL